MSEVKKQTTGKIPPAERLAWLKSQDIAPVIQRRYGYMVSQRTLTRWRRRYPLALPCTRQLLFRWFDAIMRTKRHMPESLSENCEH